MLSAHGRRAQALHGGMEQRQRDRVNKSQVLKDLSQVVAEAGGEDDVTPGFRRRFDYRL